MYRIYLYVYIYIYICVYIYVYIQAYVYIYIYIMCTGFLDYILPVNSWRFPEIFGDFCFLLFIVENRFLPQISVEKQSLCPLLKYSLRGSRE